MRQLFILLAFLPGLCLGQRGPELQQASHTFTLTDDSLTVFQETEFYSIVPWYMEADTITFVNNTISLNIYYNPKPTGGAWDFTSYTRDTFGFANLPIGAHTLIVNSYEREEAYDSTTSSFYTSYALRDTDTSYFQVLSDKTYRLDKFRLSLYPNPAENWITIEGLKPEEGEISVLILDLLGREVLKTKVSYRNPSLFLNTLAGGTYLVKIDNTSFIQKLLIK